MTHTEMKNLEIPLGIEAHRLAGEFATEQATNEKSKQVYLNTLAVYAVHRYLKWLVIETDLSQSDCWNPILRNRWNVADLVIPEIGTLECRPVLVGETTLLLPPEVMEDRIGYLAVQFRNIWDRVEILGFAKAPVAEVLQISQLLSLDDLIDAISPAPKTESLVNLDNWVRGIFDELWLPLEALLIPKRLAFKGFQTIRGGQTERAEKEEKIERAKKINLGLLVNRQQVALVVSLWTETEEEKGVLIQVVPMGESKSLPRGLKLKVILESDEAEVIAREADDLIQLEFSEYPGKEFTVQVSFDNESVTEKFVV
ncbi:MAG: DUF1822 family protein [Okeania sp. SIO2F4]|uniref:DUF1822 family protein n=1 Tax=Okeania sp. SIO2F4 TaxID=2607790 RepID=UPI0014296911|nr:DUF1822 family protein [Okeania sp. SIO2F4]NES06676.1 DUF1822 family protein [Okeania sp. SIO2F4]